MMTTDQTVPGSLPRFMHGVSFAFLNAKVRGQRSRVYEKDRLESLTSCRDLADLARELYPAHPLKDPLALERRLAGDHVADLARLAALVAGAPGELLRWMLHRYQLENLKVLLRWVATGQRGDGWADQIVSVPGADPLPSEDLVTSDGLATFVRRMQRMGFTDLCQELVRRPHVAERAFTIEAAWDLVYYRQLASLAGRVGGQDGARVLELVGHEIDTYALLFALRAKLNYGLEAADIVGLAPTCGRRVGTQTVRQIVHSSDLAMAIARLPSVTLGGRSQDLPDIEAVERCLWNRTCALAARTFGSPSQGPGIVVAFFYVKRVELMNLIRLIELLRYRVGRDQIRSRLIPPMV